MLAVTKILRYIFKMTLLIHITLGMWLVSSIAFNHNDILGVLAVIMSIASYLTIILKL